jgi:hypothetical protein
VHGRGASREALQPMPTQPGAFAGKGPDARVSNEVYSVTGSTSATFAWTMKRTPCPVTARLI